MLRTRIVALHTNVMYHRTHVIDLTGDLNLGIVRLVEGGRAVGIRTVCTSTAPISVSTKKNVFKTVSICDYAG